MSAELIDLDGEPCLLVVTRDMTEQKQAAAQLRLLGAAVQHANEAIILISAAPDLANQRHYLCKSRVYPTDRAYRPTRCWGGTSACCKGR